MAASLAAVPAAAYQQPATAIAEPGSVAEALNAFVVSFRSLDKEAFSDLFATDATVFFPQKPFPLHRISGRAAVTGWFGKLFDARRGEPLQIDPQDVQIQQFGDSAIATFHLGKTEKGLGRRTLVFQRRDGVWKIAHLHASSIVVAEGERG
ncbi:nuclear transport factor 2 family protein [Sphingomonas sabuli]|uniref:Nuclear transport factor 2 family protein n=1 Tax=Sphingomonas sabuli TaxID=2764186 RepID=A0A7G9L291_9SPHN|nr:nuclear transport factor 2 family protein [Sphingomonas sabuli]QNM82740.1 nuclear transport factor 2 family protein [Sphingomonas sabuli]